MLSNSVNGKLLARSFHDCKESFNGILFRGDEFTISICLWERRIDVGVRGVEVIESGIQRTLIEVQMRIVQGLGGVWVSF
jgi:hypothetical protein